MIAILQFYLELALPAFFVCANNPRALSCSSTASASDSQAPMPQVAATRPLAASILSSLGARNVARRTFASSQSFRSSLITSKVRPTTTSQITRHTFRQAPRRGYQDNINPATKAAVKKGGFRTLRWLWRITYLSAIGGLAYVGYGIYEVRNPEDQQDPDPSKKTLVVLGKSECYTLTQLNTDN